MTAFLVGLAVLVAGVIGGAFLPRVVRALVVGWTWLLTLRLPAEVKETRRAQIQSDLWEQWEQDRRLGYAPREIAFQQLLRWLIGLPSDVLWRGRQGSPSGGTAAKAAVIAARASGLLLSSFLVLLASYSPIFVLLSWLLGSSLHVGVISGTAGGCLASAALYLLWRRGGRRYFRRSSPRVVHQHGPDQR